MALGTKTVPDAIQMEHWASLVPSNNATTRMLVKTARKFIDTRCMLVRMALEKPRE